MADNAECMALESDGEWICGLHNRPLADKNAEIVGGNQLGRPTEDRLMCPVSGKPFLVPKAVTGRNLQQANTY
jgi:hypothetical protein